MPADPGQSAVSAWRKSKYTAGNGDCVEVAADELSVLVRDSRNRSGVVLALPPTQWRSFLKRIRNEEQLP